MELGFRVFLDCMELGFRVFSRLYQEDCSRPHCPALWPRCIIPNITDISDGQLQLIKEIALTLNTLQVGQMCMAPSSNQDINTILQMP